MKSPFWNVAILATAILSTVSGAANAQVNKEAAKYAQQMVTIYDLDPSIVADGSDMTEKIAAALDKMKFSRKWVTFPAGTYGISGPILRLKRGQVVKLCGEGRDATNFLLLKDVEEPIILVEGKQPSDQHGAFKMRGLHFDGGNHRGTWMSFQYSSYTDLEDIMVTQTVGSAITAFQWWDGNLVNCHFARNGDPNSDQAVIHVTDAKTKTWEGYSNNITFTICRFENNNALPIYLGEHSRKMRFVSCKFDRSPVQHIVMKGADSNIVEACEFVRSDDSTIKLEGCSGVIVNSSLIEASGSYAIEGDAKTDYCVISGNGFDTTLGVKQSGKGPLSPSLISERSHNQIGQNAYRKAAGGAGKASPRN